MPHRYAEQKHGFPQAEATRNTQEAAACRRRPLWQHATQTAFGEGPARDVIAKAKASTPVLGICNGFQVLCESGLLPSILMRNASLKFSCRDVSLRVDNDKTLVAPTGGACSRARS